MFNSIFNNPIRAKIVAIALMVGIGATNSSPAGWLFKSNEEKFQERIGGMFEANKQQILENFHLFATAKELEVQKFVLVGPDGKVTDNLKSAAGYLIVFTIFWKSAARDDGYLKLSAYYDGSVRNFTGTKVVATNGLLNEDVADGIGQILAGLLSDQ